MEVLLGGLVLQVFFGVVAFCFSRSPWWATTLGAGGAILGSLFSLPLSISTLSGAPMEPFRWNWDASHGPFLLALDSLSAFFLLPVALLGALGAIFGTSYLWAYRETRSLGHPWLFFNLFMASMVVVLVARTAFLFLLAWEMMSLAAFCLVVFEQEREESCQAGWIFLIVAHLGVMFLLLAFLLLGAEKGGLDFTTLCSGAGAGKISASMVFLLALVGFGAKAGLVPFHVWLPEAHPAAPSHVSALMSGVMIKMGVYGLLRFFMFLGEPENWWGPLLICLGLITGIMGIVLSLNQRDVKRLLAYSSIENMGLIFTGLGVGVWGWSSHKPALAVLGFSAALLHVWNHAMIKGLLFMAAGSVVKGAGSRDMECLGGLWKRMPWTGGFLIFGAIAIAALPPLNAFASKWLIYFSVIEGEMEAGSRGIGGLIVSGVLIFMGGICVLAMLRLGGITLLGSPRSNAAQEAKEVGMVFQLPMLILALFCLVLACEPQLALAWFSPVPEQILGKETLAHWIPAKNEPPLVVLGKINGVLLLAFGLGVWLIWPRLKEDGKAPTWGCGYSNPSGRMQYSGRSMVEIFSETILPGFIRSGSKGKAPEGLFPGPVVFASESSDPVRQKMYEPLFQFLANRFSRLRILQQGKIHLYLFYIVVMVVLGLAWVSLRAWQTGS